MSFGSSGFGFGQPANNANTFGARPAASPSSPPLPRARARFVRSSETDVSGRAHPLSFLQPSVSRLSRLPLELLPRPTRSALPLRRPPSVRRSSAPSRTSHPLVWPLALPVFRPETDFSSGTMKASEALSNSSLSSSSRHPPSEAAEPSGRARRPPSAHSVSLLIPRLYQSVLTVC